MLNRPVLFALLLGPTVALAQEDAAADLTVRARTILAKHCGSCHGDKPDRSTLRVLDHEALTAPAGPARPVPFVSAKNLSLSLALDLIDEGSMPPGALPKVPRADVETLREWIKSGAAYFPVRFDDEFAHRTILEDVKRLPAQDLTNARYLSLHHVAELSPAELADARKEFVDGMKSVLKAETPVVPVDPTATIFRIDLEKGGWRYRPFIKLDAAGKEVGRVPFNLYDLVLLEYPHAVIPEVSPAFEELVEHFLFATGHVRPIPFVRGDWFVHVVTTTDLKRDLQLLMQGRPPLPTGLSPETTSKPVVRRAPPPAPGTPIPALDAWYSAADPAPTDPKAAAGFSTQTFDANTKKPRDEFNAGDRFFARITAAPGTFVETAYIDLDGIVQDRVAVLDVPAKGTVETHDMPDPSFFPEYGTEHVRTFFSPRAFAAGEKWSAKIDTGAVERIVHGFFDVKKSDQKAGPKYVVDLSATSVTRKTAVIKVVEKKKK